MGRCGPAATQRGAIRKGAYVTPPKAKVQAVKIVVYDDALRAHVSKRIGWRVTCDSCGPLPRRKLRSLAVAECHWHNEDHERRGFALYV
jgi:hypothetical protein